MFHRARVRLAILRTRIAVAFATYTVRAIDWLDDLDEGDDDERYEGLPRVQRCNEPVQWEAFAGHPPVVLKSEAPPCEPRVRTDGAVVLPGLPLVPSDPTAFLQTHVLPGAFLEDAQRWKNANQETQNLAQLPVDPDGEPVWPLAGALMQRELWMTRFILMRVLGVDEGFARVLGMRILNEWHDLEPDTGLPDEALDLLRTERSKEPSA